MVCVTSCLSFVFLSNSLIKKNLKKKKSKSVSLFSVEKTSEHRLLLFLCHFLCHPEGLPKVSLTDKTANPNNKKGWVPAFREIDPGLTALDHSLCHWGIR